MAGSEQRARGEKSGGRRIDDHSFWAGGKSEGSVFPKGAHSKDVMSTEGAGDVMKYEDTNDRIVGTQKEAHRKIKGHQGRLPEYRY